MSEVEHEKVRRWVDTYLNPNALDGELRKNAANSLTANRPTLAFLPGTGLQSGALAHAYAVRNFPIIVGSRSMAKAAAHAQELTKKTGNADIEGLDLEQAAKGADIVFWLIPTTTVGSI